MTLASRIKTVEFPPGRRVQALRGIGKVAGELGQTALVQVCAKSVEWEHETAEMVRQYKQGKELTAGARVEAVSLDRRMDRYVTTVGRTLEGSAYAYEGTERGKLAGRLLGEFFPEGVGAIVQLPLEEEALVVRNLVKGLAKLSEEERADQGLTHLQASMTELLPEYEGALSDAARPAINYEQLRARQREGNERLLGVVVLILGQFSTTSSEDRKMRSKLLAAFDDQQERLREAYRGRTGGTDVDPETGEELMLS